MARKQVVVNGDKKLHAMQKGEILEVAMPFECGDSIKVDGKDHKVLSSVKILSGDMLRIILAGAGSKKEKSEDGNKQAKG